MKLLADIPKAINVSDDILVFGKTQEEHDNTLNATLAKLESSGVTLNKKKCVFNSTTLKFLGNIFTEKGIEPDPEKTKAILEMKEPTNPSEVRSLLGTINFCAKHIPHIAITSKPLRLLTRHNQPWTWTHEQQEAFDKLKQQVSETTSLAYFDKDKETEIWTDAGPQGLGAILVQRDKNKIPHTLAFASHALTETEQRYSQIEKEALALTWATRYFHLYVYGSNFKIVTDHKPLIYLFGDTNAALSSRLERWRIKLMPYDYVIEFKPGKSNPADYLSRHPLCNKDQKTTSTKIADQYVTFLAEETVPKSLTIKDIQEHTKKDKVLTRVIKNLHTGQWSCEDLDLEEQNQMKSFTKVRQELATTPENDILLRGPRLIIPTALHIKVIKIAHAGHQGICRTKDLIREKVWFPGMDRKVETELEKCILCQASTPNTGKHTPILSETPEGPWKDLNVDHKGPLPSGDYLLVIVDKYSKFPVVELVKSTAAKENVMKLEAIFATFGIPEKVTTDNGAPFNSSHFKACMNKLGIEHHKIIPRWPQANGQVERFNRVLNKTLSIAFTNKQNWWTQLQDTLRDYRETPQKTTGIAPTSLMFAYKTKSQLPDAFQIRRPTDNTSVRDHSERMKEKCRDYKTDIKNKPYKTLKLGDTVLTKQQRSSKLDQPFSVTPYKIKKIKGPMVTATGNGHDVTRHESHFKAVPTQSKETPNIKQDSKTNPKTSQNEQSPPYKESHNGKDNLPEVTPGRRYNLRENRRQTKRLIQEID